MTPRPKTSRKRSAASSLAAKRLDQAVFYLDESIYSRTLLNRLREHGATVRHAGEAFPFGTQDEVWPTACGVSGWIVLTRDQRIRRRVLEREAIRFSGAAAFALTAGEATAAETAEVVAKLLPKMVNMSVSEPKPFLYIWTGRAAQQGSVEPVRLLTRSSFGALRWSGCLAPRESPEIDVLTEERTMAEQRSKRG